MSTTTRALRAIEADRICRNCERKFGHPNTGCQTFRDREFATRHGECIVRDRLYWRQKAGVAR